MITEYRGAPAWQELTRIGAFLHARLVQRAEDAAQRQQDGRELERDLIDSAIRQQRLVMELIALPAAQFRSVDEPAHEMPDDAPRRRTWPDPDCSVRFE